jgi:SRSO17 transposase
MSWSACAEFGNGEVGLALGLGHFEGRGWRGFHHHATLCIAAYGF